MFKAKFPEYKSTNPNELTPKQFLDLEHEIENPSADIISDEFIDFKLWCIGKPSRQETFAKYLQEWLNNHVGTKVLEIGGGRTAKLSRILNQNGFNMTCIDPKLDLSISTNVNLIKSEFTQDFDISMYDYVIAEEPCDATEHIIRACTKQKVPFIMSLCGVPHKLLNGNMPNDVFEWYSYLLSISDSLVIVFENLDPFSVTPILKNFSINQ